MEMFYLSGIAQDGGATPSSSMISFTVNVVDILDPPPTFSASIYNVVLVEGMYSNVSIYA